MDNFGALFGPLKCIGSLCYGVCNNKDHSVLNNGATAAADYNAPHSSMSPYTVLREKSAPAMRPFVKIL